MQNPLSAAASLLPAPPVPGPPPRADGPPPRPGGGGAPQLQPLDLTSLRAVLSELAPRLLPSRFEKAQQSDPCSVQLALRGLQGTTWLVLSWQAEAARLHAIPAPPRQGEGSTLAQQLQHGLRGLALVALQQPRWERVAELQFAPRPGAAVERTLLLELMGRHSNLFLLDADRQVIALGRQVRSAQSRLRPIGTGDPYGPPPPQAGEPPSRQESELSWRRRLSLVPLPLAKALLSAYQGTSPALVRQLLPEAGWASLPVQELQEPQWSQLWHRWQQWLEALEAGRFQLQWMAPGQYRCWQELPAPVGASLSLVPLPDSTRPAAAASAMSGDAEPAPSRPAAPASAAQVFAAALPVAGSPAAGLPAVRPSLAEVSPSPGLVPAPLDPGAAAADPLAINRGLAVYYNGLLEQRQRQQRRQSLEQRLRAALQREQEQWQQQQALLDAVPASDALQRQADALLCLPRPDRDQIAEAQALYRRARKLRRSVAAITPRLEYHRQRIEGLETSLTFLEQLEGDADADPDGNASGLEEELQLQLERLRPLAAQAGRRAARTERQARRRSDPAPLELCSGTGLRLQVGRNHRQNEWISLRQARRGDLWFHAQELPGSHVVLKASEGLAQESDLQEAADLAAHFSRGRGNRRVPVVMVDTEALQRIPAAEPGTVRHRGGTVLWGEPQRGLERLEAWRASRSAAAVGEVVGPGVAAAITAGEHLPGRAP